MNQLVPVKDQLPSTGDTSPDELSNTQKAAIILATMEPEIAGSIIERVGDKHLRALARAMSRLKEVQHETIEDVVNQFASAIGSNDCAMKGGYDAANAFLARFVNEDTLKRLMDDVEGGPGGRSVWERLDLVDEEALTEYIATLHPQAICVILTRINPDRAANIINELEDELGRDILLRMSYPLQVNRESLMLIAESIENDFLKPLKRRGASRDPGEVIASLIGGVSAGKRDNFLEFLLSKRPDVGRAVKSSLLSFPDLDERIEPSAVAIVAREINRDVLIKALKYGQQNAPNVVEFFFNNLSKRMTQQINEEIEALTNVTLKDAESAQTELSALVRRLADEEKIIILSSSVDGQEQELL